MLGMPVDAAQAEQQADQQGKPPESKTKRLLRGILGH
jgi:hypothetical protein